MRLLNIKLRQLRTFYQNAPPYAILSHTWDQTNPEVSYEDMQQPGHIHMGGYRKIDSTCRQAEADGIEWVWIDSCCIDKSSSAELSEAINSMFRWYQKSRVCYAYLSDILRDDCIANLGSMFEQCRWFRRGWTLQELLAPDRMVFYDARWTRIEDRAAIAEYIERRTSIPAKYLAEQRGDFREARAAQRMSWASDRETTREEDIAYCLLGLFDINMPLLYGEGGRAFRRLQEEILRTSGDESVFAWLDADVIPSLSRVRVDGERQRQPPLAPSPRMFRCQRKPMPRVREVATLCEITSRGIHLELPIFQRGQSFFGLLNAAVDIDINCGISAIVLRQTEQPDVYERVGYRVVNRQHLNSSCRAIYLRWPEAYSNPLADGTNWVQHGPVVVTVEPGLDDKILETYPIWHEPYSEATHPTHWARLGVRLSAVSKNSVSEYFLIIQRRRQGLASKFLKGNQFHSTTCLLDRFPDQVLKDVVLKDVVLLQSDSATSTSSKAINRSRKISQTNFHFYGDSLHKVEICDAQIASRIPVREAIHALLEATLAAVVFWETAAACNMATEMSNLALIWLLREKDIGPTWETSSLLLHLSKHVLGVLVLITQSIWLFGLGLHALLYLGMYPEDRAEISRRALIYESWSVWCAAVGAAHKLLISAGLIPFDVSQLWTWAAFLPLYRWHITVLPTLFSETEFLMELLQKELIARPFQSWYLWLNFFLMYVILAVYKLCYVVRSLGVKVASQMSAILTVFSLDGFLSYIALVAEVVFFPLRRLQPVFTQLYAELRDLDAACLR